MASSCLSIIITTYPKYLIIHSIGIVTYINNWNNLDNCLKESPKFITFKYKLRKHLLLHTLLDNLIACGITSMLSPAPTMEPRVLLYRPSFFSLFFLSPSLYCHVLVIPLLGIMSGFLFVCMRFIRFWVPVR